MPLTLRSIWLSAGVLIAGTLAVARLTPPAAEPTATIVPRRAPVVAPRPAPQPPVADSVIAVGMRLRGRPYCTGGTSPATGFDCSGFVRYCFAQRGVAVPPSSTLQAQTGREIPRAQARPGDIIIFTGTDAAKRSPGHTGIVISQPGEPLRFIHSSSARKENGVKVSQVDSTRYEERLLGIRRVIEDATPDQPLAAAAVLAGATPSPVLPLIAPPVPVDTVKTAPAKVKSRTTTGRHRHSVRRTHPVRKARATAPKKKRK